MKIVVEINDSMYDGLGMSKSKVKCFLPNAQEIQSNIELGVDELMRVCGRVPKEVEDFLFIASVIYSVDKMVSGNLVLTTGQGNLMLLYLFNVHNFLIVFVIN